MALTPPVIVMPPASANSRAGCLALKAKQITNRVRTVSESIDLEEYVRENRDMLVEVLRYGQDPYTRACALVVLTHGGTERDIEEIKREVERCT